MMATKPAQPAMLDQIRTQLDAKVPPALQRDYLAVIVAGQHVIYGPTSPLAVKALRQAVQQFGPIRAVAYGTVKLIQMLAKSAPGRLSPAAAIPAAIALSTYGWDLVRAMTGTAPTPQQVADSTLLVTRNLMTLFGISPQRLAEGIEALRQGQRRATATSGAPAGRG